MEEINDVAKNGLGLNDVHLELDDTLVEIQLLIIMYDEIIVDAVVIVNGLLELDGLLVK